MSPEGRSRASLRVEYFEYMDKDIGIMSTMFSLDNYMKLI
jgi:hypothetical protein